MSKNEFKGNSFKKLIFITIEFMRSHNLKNLEDKFYTDNSCWSKIAFLYFNEHNVLNNLRIKMLWNRNRDYKRLVLETLEKEAYHTIKIQDDLKEKKLKIKLSLEEMVKINEFKSGKDRIRFNRQFDKFITRKLNGIINCSLISKSNWFRKPDGRKTCPFWSGTYCCESPGCECIYKMKLVSENENLILIDCDGQCQHEILEKKIQTRGEERQRLGLELTAKGTQVVKNDHIIYNMLVKELDKKVTNQDTLRQIKSEIKRSNRFSNDMIIDANATKYCFDKLYKNENLNGYVNYVNSSPFGVLLISKIQTNIWEKLSTSNYPIWHIDATGSILKNANRKQVKLYSIVSHDKTNKIYVPIAEFFSSSDSATDIGGYLYKIKHILQTNVSSKTYQIAPITVSDFDKAILNALNEQFNNCNMEQYLKWSFNLLVEKKDIFNLMATNPVICAFHLLKNVNEEIEELKKGKKKHTKEKIKKVFIDKNMKIYFMYSFAMLITSKTIDEFNELLIDLYNVYCYPNLENFVLNSINRTKQKCINRGLFTININFQFERDLKSEFNKNNVVITQEKIGIINKSSPWTKYFEDKLLIHKVIMDKQCNSKSPNTFYNPKLFELIEKRLYNVPLWTAIVYSLHSFIKDEDDRLTNNPGEGYFNILRNKILQIYKKVKIIDRLYLSEYCSVTFKNLISKYEEFYLKDVSNKEKKNFNCIYESQVESVWTESQSKKKRKKPTKSFFSSSKHLFKLDIENEKKIRKMSDENFENAFEFCNDKTEIMEPLSNYSNNHLANNNSEMSNFYFLKLINSGSNCYANAIVQALLSLGRRFFEIIFNYELDDKFKKIFLHFIELYLKVNKDKESYKTDTNELVEEVEKLSHLDETRSSPFHYVKGEQQDARDFFLDLITYLAPISIKNKFEFIEKNFFTCKKCNTTKTIEDINYVLNLSRTDQQKLKFNEMFLQKSIIDFKCENCEILQTHSKQEYFLKNNKFLILCLSLVYENRKSNSKIIDFNPDDIKIAGDSLNNKYMLKAAIIYESGTDEIKNNNTQGHYKCWVKVKNGWLEVSDTTAKFYTSLIENLDNVYLLFLEKIISSISIEKIKKNKNF